MATTETKSFCRVCGATCGIVVEVEGDRVLRVRGDVDHPLTRGYTCSKGRALPQAHHHPNRIEGPQIREEGILRSASWEYVLDDLAGKLRRIITESGPRAVGVFLGGGAYMDATGYLMARVVPGALKTPSFYSDTSIDVISKMVVSEMMAGIPGMMTRPDFERCRLVIYIGTNPLVSHGHTSMLNVPSVRLREMVKQGEVWVLDPRHTETAKHATRHLAPRHGSDYAILAFLIRELLRDGADQSYLANHAQDVDRLREAVEPFTVEKARTISGIAPEDLRDLLAAVRRAGRLSVETGTGISMSSSANVTQWLSWALMVVTGSLDREGGSWVNPGFLGQTDRLEIPPAPPNGWPEVGPESRPELRSVMGEYPCAAMADEIEAGHLRAILNLSGNLVACMPETARTVAALKKLEVFATIDVIANDTTALSTHVLATKDQLERADLSYATDIFYPSVATQYTPPVVAPVGERRAFWWIVTQLGRRIGIEFLPGIDPDTATDEDVLARIASQGRRGLDDLRPGGLTVAESVAIGWLQRYVDRIGGWRVAPQVLVDQIHTLLSPAPLVLIPRRQRHHINSRFLEVRDQPSILVSAEDAADAGLKDGDTARVRSPHGSLQGVMRIDPTLDRGVMSVPHGWSGSYNVNQLTGTKDVDPLTGMVRYSGLPVSLHPVPERESAASRRSSEALLTPE
jgi:anaerobic selenocysteine-containing dehydrogenase